MLEFLSQSLRGIKPVAKELQEEEVAQKKACKALTDSLYNNFNIFFDTLQLNGAVASIDLVDLLRALCANTTVHYVTVQEDFWDDKKYNANEMTILLQVIASLPKLETLRIHFNNGTTHPTPPTIPLSGKNVANILMQTTTLLKELHWYNLELQVGDYYEDMEPLSQALESMTCLKVISLQQLALQHADEDHDPGSALDHIVNALSNLVALEEINISTRDKYPWDEDSLGDLFHAESTLRTCRFANLELENSQVSAMGEALQSNTALRHLELIHCGIDRGEWRSIAGIFQDNHHLQYLDLSQNEQLDDEGCFAIGFCMEVNTGLTVLKMVNTAACDVTSKGVCHLFRMLEKNKTLQCFEISFTGKDDAGYKAAADALQRNQTLQKLYVENHATAVSTQGIVTLAHVLESGKNQILTQITLVFDGVDDNGVVALATAAQKNTTLKHFAGNRAEYLLAATKE
jgi:hypothetical protein